MSIPALRIQELHKSFRLHRSLADTIRRPFGGQRLTALDSVSCEVPEGEFFGLLGENGAGKTTLFKILCGLAIPESGRAEVFGVDVERHPARIRQLVAPVLANERSLSWRLSARENLRLYAALHRLPRPESERRIDELLQVVGLSDLGARMAGAFSSGMKQRLLLARALMARPRMLLLDEPTRSLDPLAARTFREFLRRDIGTGHGCTVLLATHDADEVRDLCDRVGVLHRGKLVAIGTTASLAARLGYHRFRLITRDPLHPAIEELGRQGVRLGPPATADDGWQQRDLDLPVAGEVASELLRRLILAGVVIARFERINLPLADLIERVTDQSKAPSDA